VILVVGRYRLAMKIERYEPDGVPQGATIRLAGTEYRRIPFGKEFDHWSKTYGACPDCAALQGEFYHFICEFEECPKCGGQFIDCGCLNKPPPEAEPEPPSKPDPNQMDFGL